MMWGHVLPVGLVALFAAFNQDGCEISSGNREGRASFAIVDGPADEVDLVKITVSRITLGYGNNTVNLPINPPVVIDNLLELQGTQSRQLLPMEDIRSGDYDWIRLYISERNNDSLVRERATGNQFSLQLADTPASGTQIRYLQLNQSFRIPRDEDSRFTLELDLRKALIKPNDTYYLLRPTLRLARNEDSGTISGTVADSLVSASDCTSNNATGLGNAVYLFRGTDINMGDVYTNRAGAAIGSRNPFAIANVRQASNGEYRYEFGFIPAGQYTLGFTCQAIADHPLTRESGLRFDTRNTATVETGRSVELNIVPQPR